ncbi:Uncharacterised protein [Yersinia pseudotuberculosis]|nr:Uncharacterised protein [Yersinia pseudotuberculosis]
MKDIKIEAENVISSSIFINSIMYMFTKYIIGVSINSTITVPDILNNLFFISIIRIHFTVFKIIFLLNILYLSTK